MTQSLARLKQRTKNLVEQNGIRGYPMGSFMKMMAQSMIIAVLLTGGALASGLAGEACAQIQESAKAASEKTKAATKEVAAETKELAKKGVEQTKELARAVADEAKAFGKKTAEVSKDVAAKTKQVAVETHDKVKAAFKDATR